MGWFKPKAEKTAIPPAKALWAICPTQTKFQCFKNRIRLFVDKKQTKLYNVL